MTVQWLCNKKKTICSESEGFLFLFQQPQGQDAGRGSGQDMEAPGEKSDQS
jgi:hypothetical protein